MFLLIAILIVNEHISIGNSAQIRTLRSTPNDQALCDGLSSNGYSEFILKEVVTIGPADEPLIDGLVLNSK